ncbi:acyltransferase family protein [Runella sp.]|uniref:acyltransferase family protein n=1 Tax=Runella sp. TaxID=1960881 RepID=UPI003D0F3B6E
MNSASHPSRLASLDALRGFDMLMISGGGAFIFLMGGKTNSTFLNSLAAQFEHPAWNGFTFYDFIFPLFLFLAGVSLSISLKNGMAKGIPPSKLLEKVFKRMVILFLLGILDKNAPIDIFDPAHIRYGTVLGRIGIATFLVAVLYLNTTWITQLLIAFAILGLYHAALLFITVGDYGGGNLTFEGNLVGWIDRAFMPGRLKQTTYDELAMTTQLSATCLTIFGALAGKILHDKSDVGVKLIRLGAMAAVGITAGLLWATVFPLNKHLWSSSFILLTAGMATLLVALFYWVMDVQRFTKWAFFFKVIGRNSLAIYLLCRFVDFGESSRLLFAGFYSHAPEKWHEVFNALGGLILVWLVLYVMYRYKIFVKV